MAKSQIRVDEMGLGDAFDLHFASHLTGKIKPDYDAFQHVIKTTGCTASQILFLDDNRLNIETANKMGMKTVQVRGVREAEEALLKARVIRGS